MGTGVLVDAGTGVSDHVLIHALSGHSTVPRREQRLTVKIITHVVTLDFYVVAQNPRQLVRQRDIPFPFGPILQRRISLLSVVELKPLLVGREVREIEADRPRYSTPGLPKEPEDRVLSRPILEGAEIISNLERPFVAHFLVARLVLDSYVWYFHAVPDPRVNDVGSLAPSEERRNVFDVALKCCRGDSFRPARDLPVLDVEPIDFLHVLDLLCFEKFDEVSRRKTVRSVAGLFDRSFLALKEQVPCLSRWEFSVWHGCLHRHPA